MGMLNCVHYSFFPFTSTDLSEYYCFGALFSYMGPVACSAHTLGHCSSAASSVGGVLPSGFVVGSLRVAIKMTLSLRALAEILIGGTQTESLLDIFDTLDEVLPKQQFVGFLFLFPKKCPKLLVYGGTESIPTMIRRLMNSAAAQHYDICA